MSKFQHYQNLITTQVLDKAAEIPLWTSWLQNLQLSQTQIIVQLNALLYLMYFYKYKL